MVASARMEKALLAWFRRNGRDLPWRRTRDPYAILVSEIMLQQTQVARVVPRYLAFLERWPTVEALAAASPADVIREWQGLGYNRRALNLHRAARLVAADGWPEDLTELPGVGRYTADAVARFAHERDVLPVDTNVRRVLERTRERVRAGERARPDGSRRHDLSRSDTALRALPARRSMPVARPALRAVAQARPLRGLVPTAPCRRVAVGRGEDASGRGARARRSRVACSRRAGRGHAGPRPLAALGS